MDRKIGQDGAMPATEETMEMWLGRQSVSQKERARQAQRESFLTGPEVSEVGKVWSKFSPLVKWFKDKL